MNRPTAPMTPAATESRRAYAPDQHRMAGYVGLARDFSEGRDSPRHFLERCLDTIEREDSWVHAFTAFDADAARIAADDAATGESARR